MWRLLVLLLISRDENLNSIGVQAKVLGNCNRFHYRLRVTELPDCVAALSNGEVIVADNHSDICRLKFFDCNQRYQRSLPLVDENHNNHNSLWVNNLLFDSQEAIAMPWAVMSRNEQPRFWSRPKLSYDQTQSSAHPCVPRPKLQGLESGSSAQ